MSVCTECWGAGYYKMTDTIHRYDQVIRVKCRVPCVKCSGTGKIKLVKNKRKRETGIEPIYSFVHKCLASRLAQST